MTDPYMPRMPTRRPSMPTQDEQERAEKQMLRYRMLQHRFMDDALEFFIQAYGEENAQTMGIPDTTLAPLPAQTAQLTTPGLYQTPPQVMGPDTEAARRMIDPESGALAWCGYWSRMVSVMYYTVGIGNFALKIGAQQTVSGEWRPVLRSVLPHNLVVYTHEDAPMVPVRVEELMLRRHSGHEYRYYWDVYDISDPVNPTFAIHRAGQDRDTRNYAADFLPNFTSDYAWRTPEGVPFLPYAWYHAMDTGQFWEEYRPALRHGTLRAVANWTMTGQAALWSQGNHNLVGGVDPSVLIHRMQAGNRNMDETMPVATMRNTPGKATFLPVEDDKTLQVVAMTTGVDLAKMVDFANTYSMNLASVDGISPSDATRRSANPTSGAALAISQADKRMFAAQVTPIFRRSDLDAIRKIAWVMQAATGEEYEAEGYSITYTEIPLTPTEQADLRAQLEWEEERGQRSPVDVYLSLHPGATRDLAIEAIVQAAVDERRIAARIEEVLAAEGLAPAPEPSVPPPFDDTPRDESDGEEE